MPRPVEIWTDGSASGGRGGWAAVLKQGKHVREISDAWPRLTTNQQMEIIAVVMGLHALKREGLRVHVYSDSAYVVNCFEQNWIGNWRENGWKTYKGDDVKNREIWETLEGIVALHRVTFHHIKGHLGSPLNERADELAHAARVKAMETVQSFDFRSGSGRWR